MSERKKSIVAKEKEDIEAGLEIEGQLEDNDNDSEEYMNLDGDGPRLPNLLINGTAGNGTDKPEFTFLEGKFEKSPSHRSSFDETGKGLKPSFSGVLKPNHRRKSISKSPSAENFKVYDQPHYYTKNIFNQNTKLPPHEKQRSHKFYYNQFNKLKESGRSNRASMPILRKVPGMLNKAPENRYIERQLTRKEKTNYNIFSNKYRQFNPLSEQLRMTEALYSELKWKKSNGKDIPIKDIYNYNIDIDDDTESKYLKSVIKVQDAVPVIDYGDKDRAGLNAVDDFYKHYKRLAEVQQQNEATGTKESVYTKVLKSTSTKNLLPMKMGILNQNISKPSLNLK